MSPKFYFVYCDIYRNGEKVLDHTLVTYEPYTVYNDEILVEDDLMLYVEDCINKDFEYRIAEECITEPMIESLSSDNVLQLSFREPTYNVLITELYCNFDIVERDEPIANSIIVNVIPQDDESDTPIEM